MTLDWERDLVVRATNPARFHFEIWADIRDSFLKDFDGILRIQLARGALESLINSTFGDLFLAVEH